MYFTVTFFLSFILIWVTPSRASAATFALIQYDADRHYGDYQLNMNNLANLATEAVQAGATVIVLPEGSAYGYTAEDRTWCRPGLDSYQGKTCDDVSQVAEVIPGGITTNFWQQFAEKNDVTILFCIMERNGSTYYNTMVAVNGDGLLGHYRKRFLYWIDEAYASAGRDLLVLDIEGRRYGVMICMDTNYSMLFNSYYNLGVRNIIAPMDWDQSPRGSRAGRLFFRSQAKRYDVNLLVSDQSSWDSTGFYPASGAERSRYPLPAVAVGIDGLVLHQD